MTVNPQPNANKPDARLVEILDKEPDERWEAVRQQALEAVTHDNLLAVWFQAVGDGSPLSQAQENEIERATPYQMTFTTGFDDDLQYQDVLSISNRLCSHHNGVWIRPELVSGSVETQLGTDLQRYEEGARQFYGEDTSNIQLPTAASLDEQRDQIVSLLESGNLSLFWMQAVIPETHMVVSGGVSQLFSDEPINYHIGGHPSLQGTELDGQLTQVAITQHLFVSACIADQPLSQYTDQILQMTLSNDYHHESFP